jgi:HAMP domain-containing protein
MRRNFVLGSVGLVLIFGALAYVLVRSSLRSRLDESLEQQIAADGVLLERSFALEALELVEQVRDRAATPAVTSVFAVLDADTRRARANAAADKVAEWFRDPSRRGKLGRPDVVIVTDASGKVVARDHDPRRMFGVALAGSLPILRAVLEEGRAESDVWSNEEHGLVTQQIAAAPIRDERGAVRGALLVGYGLTDGVVSAHAKMLGRDLAFVVDGRVVAASLPQSAVTALERSLAEPAVAGGLRDLTEKAAAPRFELTLAEREYTGTARRLPRTDGLPVTAVLLASRDETEGLLAAVGLIWPLTAAFAVLAVVFAWIMANSVLVPVSVIEEGVLSIVTGNLRHRIDVDDADLGGLAYRINQLVSALTGESEAAESPMKEEGWGTFDSTLSQPSSMEPAAAPLPTDPVDDPEIAAALAAESEEVYLARVFREYADAKRAVGEDLGKISAEKFSERLRGSAHAMGERHGCPVRFRVEEGEGRVILRPVLLRGFAP